MATASASSGQQGLKVLNDRHIRKKVESLGQFLLGERNQVRRIRDLSSVLPRYAELGVTCWAYWGLLLKALLVAFNITAILFAWITYKSPKRQAWHLEAPGRVVVWAEFLGVCYYLLCFAWRLLRFLWACIQEMQSPDDTRNACNLEVVHRLRLWYKSLMKLEFNLLVFLRYISPPAVGAALAKARRRVYGQYGTRIHRQDCCVDVFCCCCFYGRLWCCSVLHYTAVAVCAAAALMAVLIKLLQLRFLGVEDIRDWSATELLLIGQFVINIACLDTRQKSKRKGKIELLFDGADADEAVGERKAKSLVDNLALLVVRYRYSLLTALVQHHSLTAEDISWIYIFDQVEEDKPMNKITREYQQSKAPGSGGGGDGRGNNGAHQAHLAPRPAPPALVQSYDNPEWQRCDQMGGPYGEAPSPHGTAHPLYPGQVLVQISPRRRTGPGQREGHARSPAPRQADLEGPSAPPQQLPPAGPPYRQEQPGRFPYVFYDNGHAVGAQVQGYGPPPVLKTKYESVLWGAQAS
ncbi:hypothetical protein TSOC_011510 [Tetrabaena socialis]|uniref:Uncharacterized protein n=1 Tax=Tetrabaena socialis TaxID=47790 RepID=A0A2J7ZQF7_9CHLO|nr:hypothetical protein TSOC_011510 [Tetrabaena socialis]|eukprot:PNH02505.1 hypothetical protein TSOC_011510 [Tetrabaena socialis]